MGSVATVCKAMNCSLQVSILETRELEFPVHLRWERGCRLVPWLNVVFVEEVVLSGVQASWRFYWHRRSRSRRVYNRQTFRNISTFYILKADSVPKLYTNKGDRSWENLDCCLCNPKMNIDSAAGRLKDWQKVLHDRLAFFPLYMSRLECDTAPRVGDHLLRQGSLKSTQLTLQVPVSSGDGSYKKFRQ